MQRSKPEYSLANSEVKYWRIIHRQYAKRCLNESVPLLNFLSSTELAALDELESLPPAIYRNEVSVQTFLKACHQIHAAVERALRNTLLAKQYYITLGSEPQIIMCAHRLKARLKRICDGLERGRSIWDICKPYVVRDNEGTYLHPDLYSAAEQEIQADYYQGMKVNIDDFTGYVISEDKFNETFYAIKNTQYACDGKIIWDLLTKLQTSSLENCLNYILKYAEDLLPAITRSLLNFEEKVKFLNDKGVLKLFLTALSKKMNVGTFFLENIDLLAYISQQLSIEDFFAYLRICNPDPHFFKLLLVKDFDYQYCAKKISAQFSQFPQQTTWIIYAALLAGDNKTAHNMLSLSTDDQVERREVKVTNRHGSTGPKLFQETSLDEVTKFKISISFSIVALIAFMDMKYGSTPENARAKLYFVSHIDEFAVSLYNLKLISNAQQFKIQMTGLDRQEEPTISMETSPFVDKFDVMGSRISALEKENAELKERLLRLEAIIENLPISDEKVVGELAEGSYVVKDEVKRVKYV